jgi:hypothetical protein
MSAVDAGTSGHSFPFPTPTDVLDDVGIFAAQRRLHRDDKWSTEVSGFPNEHPERSRMELGRTRGWLTFQNCQASAVPATFTPKVLDGSMSGLCLFRPMAEGPAGFVSTAYLATVIDSLFG